MTKIQDYLCPNCQRLFRRPGGKALIRTCGCTPGELLTMLPIDWKQADWRFTTEAIAEAIGVPPALVGAKRRSLGKTRGVQGRKHRTGDKTRFNFSKIDLRLSKAENARRIGCSPERVRQVILQKELDKKPGQKTKDQ